MKILGDTSFLLTLALTLTACHASPTNVPSSAPPAADSAPPMVLTASIPLEGVKGLRPFCVGQGQGISFRIGQ
jgi:hypothetical protein